MISFLIWIIIIALLLVIYSVILWKKSKRHSRFQARLTILFFLFVLIPTVPLTLFASLLLTQSAKVLLLPGIEDALSESLEVMRLQLEEKGQSFLSHQPDIRQITPRHLREADVILIRELIFENDKIVPRWQLAYQESFANIPLSLQGDDWEAIQSGERISSTLEFDSKQFFETYKAVNDSIVVSACCLVPEKISQARSSIYWALRNYTSLSLLRDTFLEEGLIWGIAVLFILLMTLLAIYIARAIARGISEPIQKLTEGMQHIGTGNLDHRVDVKAKDEINFLVASFNRMAEELKTSRENLQKAERAAAWRDMARRVSHEIKNPLTPIQISLYRLRSNLPEGFQNKDFDESFRTIMEEIDALRRLADDFSQFARMPQISPTSQDVNEIIRTSTKLFEVETRKVSFELSLDPNLQPIQLDRELFKRAIQNLLKNAVEASYDGGIIKVRTSTIASDKRCMRIDIIDHGKGMSAEVKKHAGEPYFTTKKEGTGLGLAIVHKIISEHGGDIEIESKELEGTRVSILL